MDVIASLSDASVLAMSARFLSLPAEVTGSVFWRSRCGVTGATCGAGGDRGAWARGMRGRRGLCGAFQRGVDQFADPGARPAAFQVEPADVDPVLGQECEDGGGARRVRGDVAGLAAYEQFAEAAPAGRLRHPEHDAERGRGERGHTLRLDSRGVLRQDEAVGAGGQRAREERHPGP
ncbi:hypothetical protein GCM10018966_086600 [Streptomyces yanii]